jgi:hypothetical protein
MAHTQHCKKRLTVFLSPAGMSLTKLSLVGNNLIIPSQEEFGKRHPGWGGDLFYSEVLSEGSLKDVLNPELQR